MSERPTPVPSGAILRLCAETIRGAVGLDDDYAPVLGMGADEARVLAMAARDEMDRLREQVIHLAAEADRRVAEERERVHGVIAKHISVRKALGDDLGAYGWATANPQNVDPYKEYLDSVVLQFPPED